MNKNLFTIDDSERTRILEMHQNATKKQYLNEQQAEQFVYSNNQNPEDREQENATTYQEYLGRDSSDLNDLVGKEAIVYKSNSILKENEAYRFEIKHIDQKKSDHIYLSSVPKPLNGSLNTLEPFIRFSRTGSLAYFTSNAVSGISVYNEILSSKLKTFLDKN